MATFGLAGPSVQREPQAIVGSSLPSTPTTTLDGEPFRFTDLRGRPTIINVWNSWCGPCRREAPVLERFHARHAGQADFTMIGLVHDDSRDAVEDWVTRRGVPWTIVLDPDKRLAVDLAIISQPETYAVDAEGRIVAKHYGEITVAQLEDLLRLARSGGRDGGAT